MKKRKLFVGVLLASAAFSLAACTGNNNDTTTSAGTTPATTTTSNETTTTTSQTVQKYTVTFDSKGGKTVNAVEVNAGAKVQQPTNPTKERDAQYTYVFDKWCTDEACTTAFNFETAITGNIKLYAKWNTTVNQYTVTYESNGGSNVDTAAVDYNTAIGTAPTAPTKESTDQYDYTFDKWCSDEELQTPYDFTAPVTGDIKLYAKWTETVRTYSVTYDAGLEGLTPSVADLDSVEYGSTIAIPESLSKPAEGILTYEFVGWFLDAKFETPLTAESTVTGDTVVRAKWNISATISTVDDFLAFRQLVTSEGVNAANVTLEADLDLTDVNLPAVKAATYTGVFDGKGHQIKNATFTATAAKQGMLFNCVKGGTVKNVKFLGCSVSSESETVAVVSGTSDAATYSQIEFNGCTSKTTNTYSGLLFARNEHKDTINISEITTKNSCKAECSQYGGMLIGDVAAGSTVNFTDLYIDGEFKTTSGNGSLLAGRVRDGATINVTNAIVKGTCTGPQDKNLSKDGLLLGGGKAIECCFENVVAIPSDKSTSLFGATKSKLTVDNEFINCYYVKSSDGAATDTHGTIDAVEKLDTAVTVSWLTNTLKFDFEDVWTAEGTDGFRLKASSANIRTPGSALTKLALAGKATNRFKVGSDFTVDGLVVLASYDDGVQLVISADQTDGYTVDSSAYNKTTAGKYTITVTSKEDTNIKETYEVEVVSQTGFEVVDEFARKTYLIGEDIDTAKVTVYSVWTDGLKEKESSGYKINTDAYNKNADGTYTIYVSWTGFTTYEYGVQVIDTKAAVVDNYVYVNVDASLADAYDMVDGVETFKTVTAALDYLAAASYDDSVTKVVYVAAGTYNEKITTSLNNLHIIGKDKDTTIITYSAVESTVNPVSGSTYVLDCATLHVNGKGFGLENITVRNDFDYINNSSKEASPQGLALTINGDGAVLNNVYLYGNQDTLYLKSGRVYVKNSLIEGNVDFIFGQANGIAFFDTCEIKAIARGVNLANNGYVTAMKVEKETEKPEFGYVFYKCAFTNGENVKDGSMSLGRNWGKLATVAMIECSFTKAYSTLAYDGKAKARWEKMSGDPSVSDFAEYGSTGDGAIKEAVAGGKVLTEAQAEKYILANVLAGENGNVKFTDEFNPATELETLIAEATTTQATVINVTKDTYEIERNKTAELVATVGPWNSVDKNVQFDFDDTKISYDGKTIKGLAVCDSTTITFTIGSVTKEVTVKVTPSTNINTVTFMDGTTEIKVASGAEGDALVYPTATELEKAGFQFARWYEDAAFTKEYTGTTISDEDITLYARYIELNQAGVTYVTTAAELVAAINTTDAKITLLNDIDMTSITDFAGHNTDTNFAGELLGYGYTISNFKFTLVVDSAGKQQGMFGTLSGKIDSVKFKDCEVNTTEDDTKVVKYFSFLAGKVAPTAELTNLTFDGVKVNAAPTTQYVSLIADSLSAAGTLTVKNITLVDVKISGSKYTGGLFCRGGGAGLDIKVDGLFGNIEITATDNGNGSAIGGVIGNVKDSKFELVNADLDVKIVNTSADSQQIGGVVGYLQQDSGNPSVVIKDSTFNVDLTVGKNSGGLIGYVQTKNTTTGKVASLTIENVEFAAKVVSSNTGGARISGVVGGTKAQGESIDVVLKNISGNIDLTAAASRVGGINGSDESAANTITYTLTNVFLTGKIVTENAANVKAFIPEKNVQFDYSGCYYANYTITAAGTAVAIDQGTEKTA